MIREMRATMAKLKIGKDRTPVVLCKLAKAEINGRVARRLLAASRLVAAKGAR
jgi:hypothetical protein